MDHIMRGASFSLEVGWGSMRMVLRRHAVAAVVGGVAGHGACAGGRGSESQAEAKWKGGRNGRSY